MRKNIPTTINIEIFRIHTGIPPIPAKWCHEVPGAISILLPHALGSGLHEFHKLSQICVPEQLLISRTLERHGLLGAGQNSM